MGGTKDSRLSDLPYSLQPGDRVAAVLPAGPPDVEKYKSGVEWLRGAGFVVQEQAGAAARKQRYLAGTDTERLSEFAEAYRDPAVRALMVGRGGYGTMRLLGALDAIVSGSPPKLVIGFSDVTAIGCLLWKSRVPWLHGPLLTTVAAEPLSSQRLLLSAAAGDAKGSQRQGKVTLRRGRAEGPLIGGSLTLLAALCGTPFMPDLTGAILFVEDVGEKPYRLDRLWTQLLLAGHLAKVAGVVLGHLTACDAPDHSALEVMTELVSALGVPAATGFAFGHEAPNEAMPFGAQATLDADTAALLINSEIVRL